MRVEEFLRQNGNIWGIVGSEYIIKILEEKDGMIHICIRPFNIDGETKHFLVKDNILYPIE